MIFLSIVFLLFLFLLFGNKTISNKEKNIYKEAVYNSNIVYLKDNSSGFPVRLKIPEIKVDAAIEYVGVTSGGAMDVPKNPDNVAWLSFGPRPGEKGSAVIAGHRDWEEGEKAVFFNLSKLVKGDKIYIKDDKGDLISFIVKEAKTYGYLEDASDVFLPDDNYYLNIITCVGSWDKLNESYTNRLVVFAVREL